jgi:hypothetical protein
MGGEGRGKKGRGEGEILGSGTVFVLETNWVCLKEKLGLSLKQSGFIYRTSWASLGYVLVLCQLMETPVDRV